MALCTRLMKCNTGPLQTRSAHKLRQCERLLQHSTVQRIPQLAKGTGQIHMCQTANAQKHMWQPAMRARECRAKARSTRPAAQARMGASNVFARMPCNGAATNRPRMPYFLFSKKMPCSLRLLAAPAAQWQHAGGRLPRLCTVPLGMQTMLVHMSVSLC